MTRFVDGVALRPVPWSCFEEWKFIYRSFFPSSQSLSEAVEDAIWLSKTRSALGLVN
jgi:hypothetical protein